MPTLPRKRLELSKELRRLKVFAEIVHADRNGFLYRIEVHRLETAMMRTPSRLRPHASHAWATLFSTSSYRCRSVIRNHSPSFRCRIEQQTRHACHTVLRSLDTKNSVFRRRLRCIPQHLRFGARLAERGNPQRNAAESETWRSSVRTLGPNSFANGKQGVFAHLEMARMDMRTDRRSRQDGSTSSLSQTRSTADSAIRAITPRQPACTTARCDAERNHDDRHAIGEAEHGPHFVARHDHFHRLHPARAGATSAQSARFSHATITHLREPVSER